MTSRAGFKSPVTRYLNWNCCKIQKLIKALEVSEDWLIGNDNFKMSQQDIRLTKEQQQFVADNEWMINYMYNKKFGFLKAPYEYYYGYAAIGLCKAAIAHDDNKGTFFALAYICIKREITHAYGNENKDIHPFISLNQPLGDDTGDDALESKIPATDKWEEIEYKILAESVYQRVEPVLTPVEKEVFKLCLYENTIKDIAGILEIKYDTAHDRTERAKKKCRELINPDELFA